MRNAFVLGGLLSAACSPDVDESSYEASALQDDIAVSSSMDEGEGGGYAELRQAAGEYYDEFNPEFFYVYDYDGRPAIDAAACGLSEEFDGELYVAMFAEGLSRQLAASGYPTEIYGPAIADFEQRMLAGGSEFDLLIENQGTLAATIEAERSRLALNLPSVVYEGGCGAGEVAVVFASATPGARVWVMGALDFLYCRKRLKGGDPFALENCRWTEAGGGETLYLSGRVAFQVRSSGSDTQTGFRTIAPSLELEEDGTPLSVRVP